MVCLPGTPIYEPDQELYHKRSPGLEVSLDEKKLLEDMRPPIDRIATLIGKLTYGEVMQLAEELCAICPELTELNIPSVLWKWSGTRGASRPPRRVAHQEHQRD